ncbi:Ig-like domain-containing protein [Timonella senegalensis]|uniref:Ig-like domain-containing protein n=1 Tax=Timonella senegalensis TaxID=1465825 RepID=UPI0028B22F27|nr:hypothetical protein [Timonella senegalensis]
MRKAIAALIAVALTVLTLGTPAQATSNEWDFPLLEAKYIHLGVDHADPIVGAEVDVRVEGSDLGLGMPSSAAVRLWGPESTPFMDRLDYEWYADGEEVALPRKGFGYLLDESVLGKKISVKVTPRSLDGKLYEPLIVGLDGNYGEPLGPIWYFANDLPEARIKEVGPAANNSKYFLSGNQLELEFESEVPEGISVEYCWIIPSASDGTWKHAGCNEPLKLLDEDVRSKPWLLITHKEALHFDQTNLVAPGREVRLSSEILVASLSESRPLTYREMWEGELTVISPLQKDDYKYSVRGRLSDGTEEYLANGYMSTWETDTAKFSSLARFSIENIEREVSLFVNLYSDYHDDASLPLGQTRVLKPTATPSNGKFEIVAEYEPPTNLGFVRVQNYPTRFSGGRVCLDLANCKFTWLVDGVPSTTKVPVGELPTVFLFSPSLSGRTLTLQMELNETGYAREIFESNPIKIPIVRNAQPDLLNHGPFQGSAVVGKSIGMPAARWSEGGVKTSYQWYANGAAIKGATSRSFIVTPATVGKRLSLTIKGSKTESVTAVVKIGRFEKVAKSTAKVSGKLSTTSIRKGQSAKLAVTVKVPGTSKPTGKVTVTVGKKTFTKTVSSSQAGKVTVYLYGLSTGSNQAVKVKFTPSSSTAKFSKSSATTTVGKITVKK